MKYDDNNINEISWNQNNYDAWVERFGTPKEAAEKIKKNPSKKLFPIYKYFGCVSGKKIMNLMGSNGTKAVSLSLLGADVTVADFSKENARYANELSHEAGTNINYIISDILKLPEDLKGMYDIVFAELGILHYFTDLKPFMHTAYILLRKGGRFILRDFHPVSTKLISSRGSTSKVRKHKVTGDYFDTSLEEKEVAYSKFLIKDNTYKPLKVLLRKWTLGEIVTAVAAEDFIIKVLEEEPNLSSDVFDKGIPKTFTLVADKPL